MQTPPYVPGGSAARYVPPSDEFLAGRHKPRFPMWLKVLALLGALASIVSVVALMASPDSDPVAGPVGTFSSARTVTSEPAPPAKPVQQQTTTAPAATKALPPAPATISGGVWEVPSEVKPGKYKSVAPGQRGEGWACYWARLRDLDGGLNSIAANGNLDAGEQGILTVKKTDKFLELNGDCEWKKVA